MIIYLVCGEIGLYSDWEFWVSSAWDDLDKAREEQGRLAEMTLPCKRDAPEFSIARIVLNKINDEMDWID